MHIVTLPETLETNPGEFIKAGEYVADNLLCAQLINLGGDGGMRPLSETRPFNPSDDWNGKRILLMRAGGFGDIVNLTPTIRLFKKSWPKCEVHVASMGSYGTVLEHIPYVDGILKYPVLTSILDGFDAWVFYENAIERNPRAQKVPMADLFAEIAGFNMPIFGKFDGKPDYVVTPDEVSWAKVQYPRKPGIRRLCIQPVASGACRVYQFSQMGLVLDAFKAKNQWETFLMGAPGEIKMQETDSQHNLSTAGLSFRQSCAVVSECDCLLANDSSLLHIAGALGVPAVGLFGPFPWKLRTSYYTSVTALTGKGRCSPCFYHESLGKLTRDPFPKKCPSRDKGHCEVLATIEPKKIISTIEKVARPLKLAAL